MPRGIPNPKSEVAIPAVAERVSSGRGVPVAGVRSGSRTADPPTSRTTNEPTEELSLNDQAQITSMDEVEDMTLVKTKDGFPDMRIREHRKAFLFNPNANVTGEPDQRKYVNRPDLQKLREKRKAHKPNLIFNTVGELRTNESDSQA